MSSFGEPFASFRDRIFKAAVVLGLTLGLLACGDRLRESSYQSMSDANHNGAIERGWIPDYLPASSHDINEKHRLSSPTTWCSFDFRPADSEGFQKLLTPLATSTMSLAKIESPNATWWPKLFEGTIDLKKVHEAGYELYALRKPAQAGTNRMLEYFFFIDWSKGRAFFYQTTQASH